MRRTDALTFKTDLLTPSAPIDDPTLGQVVGGHLHCDPVPWQDPDEVHPHLARNVSHDLVSVFQLDAEHGIREGLPHGRFHLDRFFLWHDLSRSTQDTSRRSSPNTVSTSPAASTRSSSPRLS